MRCNLVLWLGQVDIKEDHSIASVGPTAPDSERELDVSQLSPRASSSGEVGSSSSEKKRPWRRWSSEEDTALQAGFEIHKPNWNSIREYMLDHVSGFDRSIKQVIECLSFLPS